MRRIYFTFMEKHISVGLPYVGRRNSTKRVSDTNVWSSPSHIVSLNRELDELIDLLLLHTEAVSKMKLGGVYTQKYADFIFSVTH